MGALYLAALIIGGGSIALQLLLSDHSSGSGDGGDAGGGHELLGHGHGDGDGLAGGLLPQLASLRFWYFTLLAFGLVGTPLHFFGLATALLTGAIAGVAGLCAGFVAVTVFASFARDTVQSGASAKELVGQVGRVLVPAAPGARGKVRVEVHGETKDFVSRADEALAEGDTVIVDEVTDTELHVARAPAELASRRED